MKSKKNILVFLFIIFSSHLLYGQIDLDRDPYEVLGVNRTADPKTIKKAYLEKAKIVHPDRNQGSEESTRKFQELTSAYHEVINDFNTRSHSSQERSGSAESTEHFDPLDEIFAAAAHNDTETLRNLAAQGLDIGRMDIFGNTPLHYAATNRNLEAIAFLLKMEAPVIQNSNGETFIDILTGGNRKTFADPSFMNINEKPNQTPHRSESFAEEMNTEANRTPRTTPENLEELSTLQLLRLYFTEVGRSIKKQGRSIKKRIECRY